MTESIDEWTNQVHQGDAAETLRELPESSVHMVMCSPPYYGLRDYGVDGQIGLEESLEQYVQSLVDVGREIYRVLRSDGVWWLNLGDTYSGGWGRMGKPDDTDDLHHDGAYPEEAPARNSSLGSKNKMLVPHKVAIALQESGWVVRDDCVWAKPNGLPHPVDDRLREQKEYLFHLTPEPQYWFDLDAVREPHKSNSHTRAERSDYRAAREAHPGGIYPDRPNGSQPHNFDTPLHPRGKNPGDVFEIPVRAFPEAHFAVYPSELCELPIKSSCPPLVCPKCGTPHDRGAEETPVWELENPERPQLKRALELVEEHGLSEDHLKAARSVGFSDAAAGREQTGYGRNTDEVERLAAEAKDALGGYFREFVTVYETPGEWEQQCDCNGGGTEPGIVLDPFAGAGTTCLVAKRLGRRFIGIDLNPEYVAMAQKRVGIDVEEPELLLDDDQPPLRAYTEGGADD